MRSNLIDVAVVIQHETPNAWKVDHGGKQPAWIPKSAAEVVPNTDGRTHTLTLEQCLAEEKGMV